ncbi:transcriptional regulator [Streptomyces sp. AN091965]|uniref:transcriptional regulator n=1 Tax=Streptomyces sp. AN091965 TaxID=2927803 RepID=UPI001F6195A1|nr:transcriptional regulator [Streptomyces sp. AN091965]MCI3929134.1 transcriptional regulator [Streptomyces sp. AN091965]
MTSTNPGPSEPPGGQPQFTARDLLARAAAELLPAPDANPFVPLVADGTAERGAVAALALEQCQVIPADRRSFRHLADRSARAGLSAGAAFFSTLAEGEGLAADRLGPLLAACRVSAEQARAYVPRAGCQAYPAYVAWLALNGEPADVVLALTANFAAWGGYCATLATALRTRYGFSDEACAFFDFFAAPAPDLDREALAALEEGVARGAVTPGTALRQGRLLQEYEGMFWASLAGRAGDARP